MEDYEKVREALQAAALRMKYVMLGLGIVPLLFLAIQVILKIAVPAESLAQVGNKVPDIPFVAVFAVISILVVTVAPRFLYTVLVKKRPFRGPDEASRQFGSVIIVLLALFETPSDLGLVLFFLTNIYWSIPFHLLSLFFLWRFNLGIEAFVEGAARDMLAAGEG